MTKSEHSQGGDVNYGQPQQQNTPGQQAIPQQPQPGGYIPDPAQMAPGVDSLIAQSQPTTTEYAQQPGQAPMAPQQQQQYMPNPAAPPMANAEYAPPQVPQAPMMPAPGAGQPMETAYAPSAQLPVDDYQYPQGQSILPEVPSVAVPPSMQATAEQMMQAEQALHQQPAAVAPMPQTGLGGFADPAAQAVGGEQISQRLAQLQNQYEEEVSGENWNQAQGTPVNSHQVNTHEVADPYAGHQAPVEEFQAYAPMQSEEQLAQAYQQQQQQQTYQQPLQGMQEQVSAQGYVQQPQQAVYAMPDTMQDPAHQHYGQEGQMAVEASPVAQEMPQGGGGLKKVMLGGAFVAALAVGGGAAYTYQYTDMFGTKSSSGSAPTIKASASPIKIIKEKLAGATKSINKAMHNRLSGGSSKTVDSSADKLTQKVLSGANDTGKKIVGASTGMLPGGGSSAAKAPVAGNAPRRVKTLIVRPDGTILRPAGGQIPALINNAASKSAAAPKIVAAPISKAGSVVASGGNKIRRMKTIGEASNARLLKGTPASTSGKPAGRTQIQPVIRKTATVAPKAPAARPVKPINSGAIPAPVRGDVGTPFVVQVTSRSSQTSALAAFADMQQKYPSLIGTYAPDIQRADLGNKGIWYRLRVGPVGSKTAAADLCSNLKQAGHPGCFVRKK